MQHSKQPLSTPHLALQSTPTSQNIENLKKNSRIPHISPRLFKSEPRIRTPKNTRKTIIRSNSSKELTPLPSEKTHNAGLKKNDVDFQKK